MNVEFVNNSNNVNDNNEKSQPKLTRFDLEQAIMNCWCVVDDLKVPNELVGYDPMDIDDVKNYMMALSTVYQAKFARLFDIYETIFTEGKLSDY